MLKAGQSDNTGSSESVRPNINEQQQESTDEEDSEEDSGEVIKPEYRQIKREPTQQEIDDHNINHAKFRSWCPHCIKGQATSFPHTSIKMPENDVPIISIDYAYMHDDKDKKEDNDKGMSIIVWKDKDLKIKRARVVPKKGVDTYAVDRIKDIWIS